MLLEQTDKLLTVKIKDEFKKFNNCKILAFNKEHYARWKKKKKLLFIKTANRFDTEIIKNGSYVLQRGVANTTAWTTIILAHFDVKK